MNSISVNQFRDNLKTYVEQTVSEHEPIKVTRRAGDDFVVMSADDWDREQETLHILQSSNLMKQISESMSTHQNRIGYNRHSAAILGINFLIDAAHTINNNTVPFFHI